MTLSVTVTPGLIGGNIVWPVIVIIHVLRLEIMEMIVRRRGGGGRPDVSPCQEEGEVEDRVDLSP